MKRLYTLPLIVMMLSFMTTSAQQYPYKGKIGVSPVLLEQRGDSLYISVDYNMSGVKVVSRRYISLKPLLISPEKKVYLPPIVIRGRNNNNMYKRSLALMSKSRRRVYLENDQTYATIKGFKADQNKSVQYRLVMPYENWMGDARLDMLEEYGGCKSHLRTISLSPLIGNVDREVVVEPYEVTPYIIYIQPVAEQEKRREKYSEAYLDFEVGSAKIRSEYMDNPKELQRITDMMSSLHKDAAVSVRSITVTGYASPEGSSAVNQMLSVKRAEALVDYMLPQYPYARSVYVTQFGGENWEGLRQSVEVSSMAQKQEVLSVLKHTVSDQVRKTELQNLAGGSAYKYMLRELYPALRKAVCKVNYVVKSFDVMEAIEVFKVSPQNLSLNEMYLVANSYEIGSDDFVDVMETAVRLYPNNAEANINAATAAVIRRDFHHAERYLSKVSDADQMAEYFNTMGVMHMLENKLDSAEVYLQKAADAGLDVAKQNLQEIAKKRANMEQLRLYK